MVETEGFSLSFFRHVYDSVSIAGFGKSFGTHATD